MPKHLTRLPKLEAYKNEYQPKYALPNREWISLPTSDATTVATRREWFRLMFWNVMTDAWTKHAPRPPRSARTVAELERMKDAEVPVLPSFTTEPVATVKPRVAADQVDWMHRSCKIVDEVLYHDPDILMLNEVNRVNFDTTLWKMLRLQGYGALYVSARHDKALTRTSEDLSPHDVRNPRVGSLMYESDIGNAILYHKGRYFPYFMPGIETPNHIPYMHVAGLRDRATNMTTMVVVVQLTAGDDAKAVAAREWEANGVLKVVEAINRDSSDRGYTGTVIAGDFNNSDPDEPCVAMMRERYASAYDVVGGTRWTTWYHTDVEKPWVSPRHLHPTWEIRNFEKERIAARKTVDEVKAVMQERAQRKIAENKMEASAKAAIASSSSSSDVPNTEGPVAVTDASQPVESEDASAETTTTAAETDDALAAVNAFALEEKRNMLELRKKGIVKRTSDFIFIDSENLTTLRVLDAPSDAAIDPEVLLPNAEIPSHHIPLVVDLCWNDIAPPPVQREKGERK